MIGEYTFTLNDRACKPIYSDELKKSYTLDKDNSFYTVSLQGDITFVGDDYLWIMAQPFDTNFLFNIYYKGILYYAGYFTRTNCIENQDDQNIKPTILTAVAENDVLAGYDKEVDIVALKPRLDTVTLYRRPVTQHYLLGDNSLYCNVGGTQWVQTLQVEPPTHQILLDTYHFTSHGDIGEIYLTRESGSLNPTFAGSWYLTTSSATFYKAGVSGVRLDYYLESGKWFFMIQNTSTLQASYTSSNFVGDYYEFTCLFTNVNNPSDRFTASGYWSSLYSRTVVAKSQYESILANPLPAQDIVQNNRNYKYAFPGELGSHIAQPETSETATEWGRTADGRYFNPPDASVINFFPIKRDRWIGTSMWINMRSMVSLSIQDTNWRVPFLFKDAYVLQSVIDLLLKQINPNYQFNRINSQFLYNYRSLGFAYDQTELYLTQKTNILRDNYDQAAQHGNVSLKQILDMLWLVYQCKWHMVGDTLHIEHISYYKNGESYQGTGFVEVDLTSSDSPRHNLPMTFTKGKYTYDKGALPEEITYAFGEQVSEAFQSGGLISQSVLVEKGKREQNTLSLFNPDIDSLLLQAEAASKDGFALLSINPTNKRIFFMLLQPLNGKEYYIQNGYLSYKALLPVFFMHDLPTKTVKINGVEYTGKGIRRTKKQSIWFTYEDDPEPQNLIKTQAGDGQIEKMDINLTSRRVDLTLRYDTY